MKFQSNMMSSSINQVDFAISCYSDINKFIGLFNERALPHYIDGTAISTVRILWGCHEILSRNRMTTSHKTKSSKIVGHVMGEAHPHGDLAIYKSIINLASAFKMRNPLLKMMGNSGNPAGDPAAASRYTELTISDLGLLLMDEDLIPEIKQVTNYLNEREIWAETPSIFSHSTLNGHRGIGIGLTSSLPSFNIFSIFKMYNYFNHMVLQYCNENNIHVLDLIHDVFDNIKNKRSHPILDYAASNDRMVEAVHNGFLLEDDLFPDFPFPTLINREEYWDNLLNNKPFTVHGKTEPIMSEKNPGMYSGIRILGKPNDINTKQIQLFLYKYIENNPLIDKLYNKSLSSEELQMINIELMFKTDHDLQFTVNIDNEISSIISQKFSTQYNYVMYDQDEEGNDGSTANTVIYSTVFKQTLLKHLDNILKLTKINVRKINDLENKRELNSDLWSISDVIDEIVSIIIDKKNRLLSKEEMGNLIFSIYGDAIRRETVDVLLDRQVFSLQKLQKDSIEIIIDKLEEEYHKLVMMVTNNDDVLYKVSEYYNTMEQKLHRYNNESINVLHHQINSFDKGEPIFYPSVYSEKGLLDRRTEVTGDVKQRDELLSNDVVIKNEDTIYTVFVTSNFRYILVKGRYDSVSANSSGLINKYKRNTLEDGEHITHVEYAYYGSTISFVTHSQIINITIDQTSMSSIVTGDEFRDLRNVYAKVNKSYVVRILIDNEDDLFVKKYIRVKNKNQFPLLPLDDDINDKTNIVYTIVRFYKSKQIINLSNNVMDVLQMKPDDQYMVAVTNKKRFKSYRIDDLYERLTNTNKDSKNFNKVQSGKKLFFKIHSGEYVVSVLSHTAKELSLFNGDKVINLQDLESNSSKQGFDKI